MNESKIELTERLRREGRWAEASLFKDRKVKELRSQGVKRPQAADQAWEAMATEFPPLPKPAPDPVSAADRNPKPSAMVAGQVVDHDHRHAVRPNPGSTATAEGDDDTGLLNDLVADVLTRWEGRHHVGIPPGALAALRADVAEIVLWCHENPGAWTRG